jgi:hypothetical protein
MSQRHRATAIGFLLSALTLAGGALESGTSALAHPATSAAASAASMTAFGVERWPADSTTRLARAASGKLPVSRASATVVQAQPAAGSCHSRGSGAYSRPDPACTPGALNPAVTQATIGRTICVSGWTSTVRPPESITEREKFASMRSYGDRGSMSDYEYDHLVALELGGAVNDARNLWPEPGGVSNPKDRVENALHRMVCNGHMRLADAQHVIATGWVAWANSHGYGGRKPASTHHRGSSTPRTGSGSGPKKPIADVNCSDFATHAAAQRWFNQHGGSASNDVAGLDGDHNGLACQSLP